jgi:RND family efflux transporter MFP subunit
MKKYSGLIFLAVSIGLAIIFISNKPVAVAKEESVKIPFVESMMLISQNTKASISSQGIISPSASITLISELGSKVEWISLKMQTGSSFLEGDTLIILDKRDYELALITAESDVLNAKVNLEREKAESDLATKEWKRVGAGSGSDLALRKPQLAQAKATFAASEANLERAQRNLKRTVFIAPFDGRVKLKNIDVGATVFPGTILGTIYKSKSFEVRLPIADQDVPFTGLSFNGQKIDGYKQLDVKFYQGKNSFDGKIIRAEAEVDPLTRMLSVVAEIENDITNNIVVGQFVQALISGGIISNVTILPRSSVRNESVWVIDKNLKLYNRPVEIIRYESEFALIGDGLELGDRLLTSRLSSLVNGLQVTFELN